MKVSKEIRALADRYIQAQNQRLGIVEAPCLSITPSKRRGRPRKYFGGK